MIRTKLVKAALIAGAAVPASMFLSTQAAGAATTQSYVVKSGDTLSAIAAAYGTNWPALAEANHLANPNLIYPGQVIELGPSTSADPAPSYSSDPPVTHTVTYRSQEVRSYASEVRSYASEVRTYRAPVVPTYHPSVVTVRSVSATPGSSFESCVIRRESSGNAQVMNSSGHYGLYQFSSSTWAAAGGSPSLFGHATAAQQQQVFNQAVARFGTSPWAAYDGC